MLVPATSSHCRTPSGIARAAARTSSASLVALRYRLRVSPLPPTRISIACYALFCYLLRATPLAPTRPSAICYTHLRYLLPVQSAMCGTEAAYGATSGVSILGASLHAVRPTDARGGSSLPYEMTVMATTVPPSVLHTPYEMSAADVGMLLGAVP
eukprot:1477317-Rhodomonas_salina.2